MLEETVDTPETTEDTQPLQLEFHKPRSRTGFHGVCLSQKSGRYIAAVSIHGKANYLGQFDTAREAAEIYDARAKQLLGAEAILNFPEQRPSGGETGRRRPSKAGSVTPIRPAVSPGEASVKTIDAMRQLLTLKNFLVSLTPEQHNLLMEL
jgi:hypothetical protein